MYYKIPDRIKICEALGTLADKDRLEVVSNNMLKVYSSSRNKFYNVYFDEELMKAYSNDNLAFFKGKISYPIIIFLFLKKKLDYNEKFADELEGIIWKDLHMKYNKASKGKVPVYDYDLINKEVDSFLSEECINYISLLYEQLKTFKIEQYSKDELKELVEKNGFKIEPPKAY